MLECSKSRLGMLRGSASIEMVLVLPVLVLLFYCILQVGEYNIEKERVILASRCGAFLNAYIGGSSNRQVSQFSTDCYPGIRIRPGLYQEDNEQQGGRFGSVLAFLREYAFNDLLQYRTCRAESSVPVQPYLRAAFRYQSDIPISARTTAPVYSGYQATGAVKGTRDLARMFLRGLFGPIAHFPFISWGIDRIVDLVPDIIFEDYFKD